jgi:hypothetical protein
MSRARTPSIKVGDIVRAEEPDHRYGAGPLLLRVTAVGTFQREPDGIWQEVRGHQIGWNGHVEASERYAWVRLAGIRLNRRMRSRINGRPRKVARPQFRPRSPATWFGRPRRGASAFHR